MAPASTYTRGAAYIAPHFGMTMMIVPLNIVVSGIYADHYGLALTSIAWVLLVSRFSDAITDPLVGYWSDRVRAKTGTRKPFVLAGGVLLAVCCYFLYLPPTRPVSAGYFALWYISLFVGLTLFILPHMAWAGEIARDAREKSLLYSLLAGSNYVGHILFFSVPLLPWFATEEITPETLRFSVTAAIAVLIPGLLIAWKYAPDGAPPIATAKPFTTDSSEPNGLNDLLTLLRGIRQNRPFLLYVLAFMFSGLSVMMWYSLIFIYVNNYLGMGDKFARMFLYAFIFGLCVTPVWYRLSVWLGKKTAWLMALGIVIATFIYTGTLTPGETSFAELLVLKMLNTFGAAGTIVVAPAMLSDISDYGTLKTGVERNGTYFALQSFLTKLQGAVGGSIALAIAGWFGFNAAAETQSPEGAFGLTLAIAWIPPVFTVIAMVCVAGLPMNERRHAIIRKRLDQRMARRVNIADEYKESDKNDPDSPIRLRSTVTE